MPDDCMRQLCSFLVGFLSIPFTVGSVAFLIMLVPDNWSSTKVVDGVTMFLGALAFMVVALVVLRVKGHI